MSIINTHRAALTEEAINAGLARGRIERSRAFHAAFASLGRAVRRMLVRPARLRVKPHGAGCAA